MKKTRRSSQPANLARFNQASSIWLCDFDALESYRAADVRMLQATPEELNSLLQLYAGPAQAQVDSGQDVTDEENPYNYMTHWFQDLAILSIKGQLVSEESFWNRYFGRVSYEEIRNAAIKAVEEGARGILLNIESPGGAAIGVKEATDLLGEINRSVPIYAHTSGQMLSGGYWLGASARQIYAGEMAMVGSIGVVTAHFSYARALKEKGIDVTMIRKGEFKALGSPYEKLDEKARAEIEARMGKVYDLFLAHVSDGRNISVPTLIETAAEGRVFFGDDAKQVGLVDSVSTFDQTVRTVSEKLQTTQVPVTITSKPTLVEEPNPMKKIRVLNEAGIAAVASGMAKADALKDVTLTVEVTEAEAAKQAADEAAAEAAAQAAATAVTDPAPANAAAAPAAADTSLVDRLMAVTTELAQVKMQRDTANEKLAAAETNQTALMKICADSINRMELPMGHSALNLSGQSASDLIAQYNRSLSQFNSKFKVGAQAVSAVDQDTSPVQNKPTQRIGQDAVAL